MTRTSSATLHLASKLSAQTAGRPTLETTLQPAASLFAVGMLGLGFLALVFGDFAMVWQPVPPWVPGRTALAYASGLLMLLAGMGLLLRLIPLNRSSFTGWARAGSVWAVRILFPYLIAWALLKTPALVVAPQVEGVWLGFGELAVLLAGGWVLFARLGAVPADSPLGFASGNRGVRFAKYLFAVWVIPIGVSHFFYVKETVDLVPAWLPFRMFWAYLTGAGHIAAGLGVLFSVAPGVALFAEAAMLSVITLLVWFPAIVHAPLTRLPWTAFWISWSITAAVWVLSQGMEKRERQS